MLVACYVSVKRMLVESIRMSVLSVQFCYVWKASSRSWTVAGGETNPDRWATGFAEEGGLGSLVGFCSWRKAWFVGGKWWITVLIGMMWTAVSLYFICTYFTCTAVPFIPYRYVVCTVCILRGIVCCSKNSLIQLYIIVCHIVGIIDRYSYTRIFKEIYIKLFLNIVGLIIKWNSCMKWCYCLIPLRVLSCELFSLPGKRWKWARFVCVDFSTKGRVKVVQAHAMESYGVGWGGIIASSTHLNLGWGERSALCPSRFAPWDQTVFVSTVHIETTGFYSYMKCFSQLKFLYIWVIYLLPWVGEE